jgi:chemotaxis regulatin CheY-phosphate phosphatase CheZ
MLKENNMLKTKAETCNSKLLLSFALATMLSFEGCAHTALEKKIDAEIAAEGDLKNQTELRAEVGRVVDTTLGLSPDQRTRLSSLRSSTRDRLSDLNSSSLKLSSVLIKELMTADYNDAEVGLIKKRMKNIENERLGVIFEAVKVANSILGRDAVKGRYFMEDIMVGGRSRD